MMEAFVRREGDFEIKAGTISRAGKLVMSRRSASNTFEWVEVEEGESIVTNKRDEPMKTLKLKPNPK
ncbi:hypothetical protein llap_136 [Limosa lapponica baueri]|uniref:Uncharacterized protein n=1 Tax=Limosa lapponica baueri TaxID=1758121 RepID=A0A2I0UU52_LIMLA|nr:hypothetical protein llap_136 [Limosa lapponica baueri]